MNYEINLKNLENFGIIIKESNNFNYEKIEFKSEELPNNYCLIETKACGFGPYDTGYITGRLTINPKREFNLGCEGSGVVIKLGPNCDESLLGKRVAFINDYHDTNSIGSFARYSIINTKNILVLPEKIDFNQGAYILANPLTARGMFDEVISNSKTKAIIQDTSSSSLGKMVTNLCLKNGFKIINIVRKEENIKFLEQIGSTYNLNSNSKDFLKILEQLIKQINPDIYITYQGGNFPSRIFEKMPNDSKLISCGNINNEKLFGFSTTDFIFKGKSIEGFQILNLLNEICEQKKTFMYESILNSMEEGNSEFYTNINREYKLEDFQKGYEDYKNNSSLGKIIFKP